MTFIKRIGPAPKADETGCVGCNGCPDIWELENGDFAVIGEDISSEAANLPPTAGCAPGERMVRIPRRTLVLAKSDIPDR
jgi:hypothetical protein